MTFPSKGTRKVGIMAGHFGLFRDHQWRYRFRPAPTDLDAELEDLVLATQDISQVITSLTAVAATTLGRTRPDTACGITHSRPKKPPVRACSGPLARSLYEVQSTVGEGPCLTVMAEQRTVHATDLADDDRWPRFAKSAAKRGIRSWLGVPLEVEGKSRAVLNLSALTSNAFSDDDVDAAEAFAGQASRKLRPAVRIAELNDTVSDLYAALEHRAVIDMALGVVMSQNHCDHEAAFAILRRAASSRNQKLRDVAASVVASVSGKPTINVHFDA